MIETEGPFAVRRGDWVSVPTGEAMDPRHVLDATADRVLVSLNEDGWPDLARVSDADLMCRQFHRENFRDLLRVSPPPALVADAMTRVHILLNVFHWRPINEGDIQRQMAEVFAAAHAADRRLSYFREVSIARGRLDFLVCDGPVRIAVEVKIKPVGATEVERQVMRYAEDERVDGVLVVTTLRRLALELRSPTLGGKPFRAAALRTAL